MCALEVLCSQCRLALVREEARPGRRGSGSDGGVAGDGSAGGSGSGILVFSFAHSCQSSLMTAMMSDKRALALHTERAHG